MKKRTEQRINELSLIEQQIQGLSAQKQQFNTQLLEVESALNELSSSKESYKIIGNVMIKMDKEKLIKELKEKNDSVEIRIKSIEKQEGSLREKAKSIQSEVMKELKE